MNNSNTVTKLTNNEQFRRAEQLLRRAKEQAGLTAIIEKDKEWFRDQADGTTLNQVVPGLGSVQVKKGAAPSSGTSYVFNTEKFKLLDVKAQKALVAAGVVTLTPFSRPEGTPSVCVTLNK